MSKTFAVESPKAPPRPARLPLGACLGKTVKCPDCGAKAVVSEARGGGLSARPVSSIFWVKSRCSGSCGTKLQKRDVLAEVLDEPAPPPRQMLLAEAVGRLVRCPADDCGETARAAWTDQLAHCIDCPVHQCRAYPSETVVEVIA